MATSDPRPTPTQDEILAIFALLQEKTAACNLLLEECRTAKTATEAERAKATEASIAAIAELAATKVQKEQATRAATAIAAAQKIAEIAKDKASAAQAASMLAQAAWEAEVTKITAASTAATAANDSARAQQTQATEAAKAATLAQAEIQSAKVSALAAQAATTAAQVATQAEHVKATTASNSAEEALAITKAQQQQTIDSAKASAIAQTTAQSSSETALEESKAAAATRTKADEEFKKIVNVFSLANESLTQISDATSKSVLALDTSEKANVKIREFVVAAKADSNLARASAEHAVDEAKKAAEAHDLAIVAGLAGAFNKKALETNSRLLLWLIVLIGALVAVGIIGYGRYADLREIIATKPDNWMLGAQLFLTIFGVGAPVWMAWIATRMISMNFVISSDYAYKASLAQAYTGFREQAKGLDPLLEQRLLAAAITQLDANPVRFVDDRHPGTPLQELLQQPFMQDLLQVTTFKQQLIDWFKARFKLKLVIPDTAALPPVPREVRSTEIGTPTPTVSPPG